MTSKSRSSLFLLRLIHNRTKRLYTQYSEVKNTSGSSFSGLVYVAKFIAQRRKYLYRHLRARRREAQPLDFSSRQTPILAVKLIGGVGDYLIAMRFLADLSKNTEPFSVDIYCGQPETVGWIFRSLPCFNSARSEFLYDSAKSYYDASLWLSHAIIVDVPDFSARRLIAAPRLRDVLETAVQRAQPLRDFARHQPLMDNQLAHLAVSHGATRMTFAHWVFGITPGDGRQSLPATTGAIDRFGLRHVPYVTVHNGQDQNVVLLGQASTKYYPHFSGVLAEVRKKFPHVRFVQVGTRDGIAIEQVDLDLRGRTSLPDVAAVLGGALCHLDVESGLVHMAHCLGTPAVVVFGPTPIDYFGYGDNTAIPPQTCGDCWATQETWMALCPRGFKEPVCTSQPSAVVAQALIARLAATAESAP